MRRRQLNLKLNAIEHHRIVVVAKHLGVNLQTATRAVIDHAFDKLSPSEMRAARALLKGSP